MGIIGGYFFMYYSSDKIPRAFLIKDYKFAKSFEFIFSQMWKIAS